MPLLRRGVTKIIVCNAAETPVSLDFTEYSIGRPGLDPGVDIPQCILTHLRARERLCLTSSPCVSIGVLTCVLAWSAAMALAAWHPCCVTRQALVQGCRLPAMAACCSSCVSRPEMLKLEAVC